MVARILSGILILLVSSASVGQVQGGCNANVAARTGVNGCYLVASEPLGTLPAGPLFWHLYTYRNLADAQAHRVPRSTVVDLSRTSLAIRYRGKRLATGGGQADGSGRSFAA
jgi:hypothetical protein